MKTKQQFLIYFYLYIFLTSMKKEEIYENPSTLSYYSHNFRFYFAGFSIAVGIFIILFVL
ncbi:hypothetical protein IJU97_00535 [bacterium]|nr:hypothetical protein [bacterium]